jgi:hypothetical protein
MEGIRFGDVVMLANRPLSVPFRTELIPTFSNKAEAGAFYVEKLSPYIRTPFLLSIHYDGFIVDASAWRPEFLNYDYIGAKWAWHTDGMNVGNSGFCLLSKKLLDIWKEPCSDDHLCRVLRPQLEAEHGIRFAPESVADLFAYEGSLPRQPTFGFHGLFNLWRHIDDDGMEQVAHDLADYVVTSPCYAKIIAQYYLMRKFAPLRAFYARYRSQQSTEETQQNFSAIFNEAFARELVNVGENLIGNGPISTAPVTGFDIKQPNEEIDTRGRLFPWER